ncbi:MAG: hypothetical protein NXH89_04740 [Cyclobacteriaceae bacterium]|nr:hypothetical protein [Cyclobacteriaceae bacterium]
MISWNNILDNLKGDIQDKSKNPFFGAFIFTWFIRNWELLYIIFNMESDLYLEQKLDKIKNYFLQLPPFDFWITVGLTFLVIILGYIFLNIARIISNFSEKIITPHIYKWTAGKVTIVLKEEYDKVIAREVKLKEKQLNLKNENERLETQIEKLEQEVKNLIMISAQKDESIETGPLFSDEPIQDVNRKMTNKALQKVKLIYDKLNKKNLVVEFKKVAAEILSGIPLEKHDGDILEFVLLKLIEFKGDENTNRGTAAFALTDLGNELLDKINYDEDHTI